MNEQLLLELKQYIENNLFNPLANNEANPKHRMLQNNLLKPRNKLIKNNHTARLEEQIPDFCFSKSEPRKEQDLKEFIRKTKSEETFSTKLLKYIDQTGETDAEIYKRAGIDRRHFSKIRCDKEYRPKKATAVALCLALKLEEGQTEEMLKLAGYSLSNSDTGDLVIKFCIKKRIYNLMDVNEALDYFGQKAIGVVG